MRKRSAPLPGESLANIHPIHIDVGPPSGHDLDLLTSDPVRCAFPAAAVTASVAGSLLLVLIGVAFLNAATLAWWRLGKDPSSRVLRLTGVVIDVLVGLAALADGIVSVIGEPERVVVWSIGSAALVVSLALLIVRHPREPDPHL
jgi:hypothetical protein